MGDAASIASIRCTARGRSQRVAVRRARHLRLSDQKRTRDPPAVLRRQCARAPLAVHKYLVSGIASGRDAKRGVDLRRDRAHRASLVVDEGRLTRERVPRGARQPRARTADRLVTSWVRPSATSSSSSRTTTKYSGPS